MSNQFEAYLGDGLYASFDGFQIRLWADRFDGGVHEVFLEPEVLERFKKYVDQVVYPQLHRPEGESHG